MESKASLDAVYTPSENVVAREIEGEIIIVPLTAGIGDMEDELYTLNETGKAIWDKLNGRRRLDEVVDLLAGEYEGSSGEIREDVIGLVEELVKRGMLDEASGKEQDAS